MGRLTFWIEEVQLGFRELSSPLQLSAQFLFKVYYRNKFEPTSIRQKLLDPLFEAFDTEKVTIESYIPKESKSVRKEKWELELAGLKSKRDNLLIKRTKHMKQIRKYALILHHTEQKVAELENRNDTLAEWWRLKRKEASFNLSEMAKYDFERMNLEIEFLNHTIEKLQNLIQSLLPLD